MITKLIIKNLRGIRKGTLKGIAPFTILTGPNASGKSTVLDALLIGASPNPEDAIGQAIQRHPESPNGARWLITTRGQYGRLELGVGDETRVLSIEILNYCDEGIEEELISRRASPPFLTVVLHEERDGAFSTISKTGFSSDNQFATRRKSSPQPVRASLLAALFSQGKRTDALEKQPALRLIDPGLPIPLHRSFSALRRQGDLEATHAFLHSLLPDFKELFILAEDDDKPVLHMSRGKGSVPVALTGDGIQAFLQLVLESNVPEGGLLLIEEPEVYQHPKALWQTARVLLGNLRRGVQTVITTHSLELLDALLSEATPEDLKKMALFNLRLDGGKLHSSRRDGDELAFARQEMESDLR